MAISARLRANMRATASYIGAGIVSPGAGGGGSAPVLGTLTLAGSPVIGAPFSGTISGRTAGSTFALSGAGSAGLSVDNATGVVSGTPTIAGAVNITETLAGATGSPRATNGVVTVVAAGSALAISGAPTPSTTIGGGTPFTPTISGGTEPYTLSLFSGTLPAGRSLSGNTIVGTYTTAGTYNYVLRATDSVGATADLTLSITVTSAVTLATLSLSASAFTAGVASGTVIGNIIGKTAGSTITVTPNDGRLAVSSDGTQLLVGLSASSAGSISATLIETLAGATGSPKSSAATLTVNASSGTLPAYAYESEATAYFAAAQTATGSPLSDRRKYSIDRFYKRMKAAGLLTKIKGCGILAGESRALVNIRLDDPTKAISDVATAPTFTPRDSISGTAAIQRAVKTGIFLDDLTADNWHMAMFCSSNASETTPAMGAYNTTSGIALYPSTSTPGTPKAKGGSPTTDTIGASGVGKGEGWTLISRSSSTGYRGQHNAIVYDVAVASVALPHLEIYVNGANSNGTATSGTARRINFWSVGSALTEAEAVTYYAIVRTLVENIQYGEPTIFEAGKLPQTVSADVVVYGASQDAVLAAYRAKRDGASVIIVGGWRDRHLGGILTGGLSATDWVGDPETQIGGITQYLYRRAQALSGAAAASYGLECRYFKYGLQSLLDPTLATGLDIPVYWSNGVDTVAKTGTRITSFTTVDGRTFSGSRFIDTSRESDLMARAGVTYVVGREGAGTGTEADGGYQLGGNHGYTSSSGSSLNVDPFVVPGDPTSGLLYHVNRNTFTDPSPTLGTADAVTYKNRAAIANGSRTPQTQAYNFRLAYSSNIISTVKYPTTPPPGYSEAKYEAFFRWCAAATAQGNPLGSGSFNRIVIVNPAAVGDMNSQNGFSTDAWGQSWAYPEASYTARETIWKAHENHIRGLFYAAQYSPDSRIPSALRTSVLTFGFADNHFLDPHPNDALFWPPQLYVREARRMVGDLVVTGNMLTAADGSTPTSIKTIAVASYDPDCHHMEGIAELNAGVWRIRNVGNIQAGNLGANHVAPLPYECMTPQLTECTNLLVTAGLSMTHIAYGSARMEITYAMLGEAAGAAAALSLTGDTNVQNVDYTALRTKLTTGMTLTGEVAAYLPQTN